MERIGTVETICRNPVKSMAGEDVAQAFVGFAGLMGALDEPRDRLLRSLCSVITITASFSLAQKAMLCRSANTSH
jgi:hypothetical protein